MYRIEDTEAATRALQGLLGLGRSGKYDNSTRDAVLELQRDNSLPQTGVADYQTFTAIVDLYRERMTDIYTGDLLFDPLFPIVKGNMGSDAGRINDALSLVLKRYSYEGVFPGGKYIGEDTLDAVRFLRRVFAMDERDEIDARFMNRIALELDGIKIRQRLGIKD